MTLQGCAKEKAYFEFHLSTVDNNKQIIIYTITINILQQVRGAYVFNPSVMD